MRVIHKTPADYRVGTWSGGTTTELFLWPENGSYQRREFRVRISSARVELAESDFTALPGVTRFITPLAGGFTLTHPSGAPIPMAPMDPPYRFSGQTPTHCSGQARDFNLMLKGTEGEMTLATGQTALRPGLNGLYAPEGACVTLGGRVFQLGKEDLLLIFTEEPEQADVEQGTALLCYARL